MGNLPRSPLRLPEEDFSEDLRDFVSNCLLKDPAQRLTASQLLHHAFITKHVQTAAIENGDMHSTLIQQAVKSPVGKSSSVSSSDQDDDHTPTLSTSMPMRMPPQMMATIPERRRTKSRQNVMQAGTKVDSFAGSVASPSSLDPIDHSSVGVLQPQQKPLR